VRQEFTTLSVSTKGRGFYEITGELSAWISKTGIRVGLATIHIQHTSASLLIQENADPEVRRDFERFFKRLVPDGDEIFEHTSEGEDDMPAHVRSALTASNLSVPVQGGEMTLGTWQGIYVWEHRKHSHTRKIAVHLLGS
jgi:secondary thiamine-phosphate synthase enzyme